MSLKRHPLHYSHDKAYYRPSHKDYVTASSWALGCWEVDQIRMNDSEKLVQEYLARQGFSNVAYEPDGNVPPDFLVDGRIAVEVRRLNQNKETTDGYHGLEEFTKPFNSAVRSLLVSLGPPTGGVCWRVSCSFRRPQPPVDRLKREMKAALTNFKNQKSHQLGDLRINERLSLRIYPAEKTYSTFFVFGAPHDRDEGGFMVAEMARNIVVCVAKKTRKIAKVRDKYAEWWLVLVDRIGYGLDESDRDQLRKLEIDDPWDKIILVNPMDPGAAGLLVSSESRITQTT